MFSHTEILALFCVSTFCLFTIWFSSPHHCKRPSCYATVLSVHICFLLWVILFFWILPRSLHTVISSSLNCCSIWTVESMLHCMYSWIPAFLSFVTKAITVITFYGAAVCGNMSIKITSPASHRVIWSYWPFLIIILALRRFMTKFIARKTITIKRVYLGIWSFLGDVLDEYWLEGFSFLCSFWAYLRTCS